MVKPSRRSSTTMHLKARKPDIPMLKLQEHLADSQWWSPEELRRRQEVELAALLDHAWRTVPAQRPRMEDAGYRPGQPVDDDVWLRIAPITRAELQGAGASFRSRATPADHGDILSVSSSGSTGRPLTIFGTVRDAAIGKAFLLRYQLWHGVDFSQTLVFIRKYRRQDADYPNGTAHDRWGDTATYPFPTGPSAGLSIHENVETQAEWLRRNPPGYLGTYPSNLRYLARHCREIGLKLPGLKKVMTVSETLSPEDREACLAAWNVPVIDHYSAREIGTAACQCPEHEHYHVQAERLILEVLAPDGTTCGPGETGRIVVTSLHNYEQPLIRYDIGDYAEVGGPCPCGRGLPVLTRVLGRSRGMMVTPDGHRYWPFFGATGFPAIAPVLQHQFIQRSPGRIEGRLVVARPLTNDEEARLRAHIMARVPHPFRLDFTYVDRIPRSLGGKFEDFRNEVPDG